MSYFCLSGRKSRDELGYDPEVYTVLYNKVHKYEIHLATDTSWLSELILLKLKLLKLASLLAGVVCHTHKLA